MIDCPKCKNKMTWQSDFGCDELNGCECEQGIVSIHQCGECDDLYTYTTNCKDRKEGELKKVEEN